MSGLADPGVRLVIALAAVTTWAVGATWLWRTRARDTSRSAWGLHPLEWGVLAVVIVIGATWMGQVRLAFWLEASEPSGFPSVSESVSTYYIADRGLPSLVHRWGVLAAGLVGGVRALHALHAGLWAAQVVVAHAALRRVGGSVAALVVTIAWSLDLVLLHEVTLWRAYGTFLLAVAVGVLALGSRLGASESAPPDALVFTAFGLAVLDNPIVLALLGGFVAIRLVDEGIAPITAWTRVPAGRLALASGALALVMMPLVLAATEDPYRSAQGFERAWSGRMPPSTLGGLVTVMVSGALATRAPGLRQVGGVVTLGAVATMATITTGMLPDMPKYALFGGLAAAVVLVGGVTLAGRRVAGERAVGVGVGVAWLLAWSRVLPTPEPVARWWEAAAASPGRWGLVALTLAALCIVAAPALRRPRVARGLMGAASAGVVLASLAWHGGAVRADAVEQGLVDAARARAAVEVRDRQGAGTLGTPVWCATPEVCDRLAPRIEPPLVARAGGGAIWRPTGFGLGTRLGLLSDRRRDGVHGPHDRVARISRDGVPDGCEVLWSDAANPMRGLRLLRCDEAAAP